MPLPALLVAAALAVALLRAGWSCFDRYVVHGASMSPTLRDGDRLLILRSLRLLRKPRAGLLVLARPRALDGREVVKRLVRVEGLPGDRRYWLAGDNQLASTDSRHFGAVTGSEISGWVLLRYWPEQRRGRVL